MESKPLPKFAVVKTNSSLMKVYCTRPRQQHEAPHLTEIPDRNLSGSHSCEICGMPLILQDRYVPIDELGQGGFGHTFLALDLKFGLESRRAIKQFRADLLLLPSAIAQAKRAFTREYETLDRLKHDRIPRIYEPFEISALPDLRVSGKQQATNYYYFVQEYIEGKDLARGLKDNRSFTEVEVRKILHQMLQVLQYIHSQSPPIIHRDIKPSNIIHADDGNLYLIDFGAIKQILYGSTVGSTQTETIFVTRGFSPPEQYQGFVDFSSDLYALGKTCICLLEGTMLPHNRWKPTATASDTLVKILDRMTAEKPSDRYKSATEVISDLATKPFFNYRQLWGYYGWLEKMATGAVIIIFLLGLSQIKDIFFPQLAIKVTEFKPPHYISLNSVPNVPSGEFKSCCSKTWIPLSKAVNPIIQQSSQTFRLESISPQSGLRNSEAGIEMLIDGKIDIALSSKQITPELLQQAANKNVRLMETTIARGSTAVVVHPSLPIQGITIDQFEQIKNGKITNWKEVGGTDLPIAIYMTDGSYLGKNIRFTQLSDTTTTFRRVAKDRGGFTVVPSNLAAIQCQIKTLSIGISSNNLISPYRDQKCNQDRVNIDVIKNGKYPITSDLKVFFRTDDPIRRQLGQAYITMLMTTEIQQRIEEAGYLPISKLK